MISVLNPEMMLTPAELAKICRVSTKTVRRWVQAGEIDALVTPGNHIRFPLSSVRKFLAERSNGTVIVQ